MKTLRIVLGLTLLFIALQMTGCAAMAQGWKDGCAAARPQNPQMDCHPDGMGGMWCM